MEDLHGEAEYLPSSVADTGSIDHPTTRGDPQLSAVSEDQQPSVRKRQRSDSYDYQAIYHSLPASPSAVLDLHSGQIDSILNNPAVSNLAPSTANSDAVLVTPSNASIERSQRAHSQPFTFHHDAETDTGHAAKKRRLFQHEHQLETTVGTEVTESKDDGNLTVPQHADESENHDLITAQLMASLQQAAEDPEYAASTLAHIEGNHAEQLPAVPSPARDDAEEDPSQHHHEHQSEMHGFPHDDILNAFISASVEASPRAPSISSPHIEVESPKIDVDKHTNQTLVIGSPSANNASPSQSENATTSVVIDPSLNRLGHRLAVSPHPVPVVPSPRSVTLSANTRPVPATVLPTTNGSSRSLSGTSSPRTPTLSNTRPVMVSAFPSAGPQLVRPVAKKTLPRDFTPSRPTEKGRRPTPRRLSGRGSASSPPMPNPYDLAVKNSIVVKPKPVVEEPDITSTLSVETLAVLEAAATSLSQIQGPVTQEHLEAIVLQLTNAGIDLSQLGLGNLVAQDEEDDTQNQYNNRADAHVDMSGSSIFNDGRNGMDTGLQPFNDMSDSQPDDMNLQAQSLIAALSALVPQSQPTAESVLRHSSVVKPEQVPTTIDLTDEPDEETSALVTETPVPDAEPDSTTKQAQSSPQPMTNHQSSTTEPANLEAQVTESSDELSQEKTRITSLDLTARIETLETLIRALEQESTEKAANVTGSSTATDGGAGTEANGTTAHNADQQTRTDATKEQPTVEVVSSQKETSPRAEPLTLEPEQGKERSNRLALYKDLLIAAKTESALSSVNIPPNPKDGTPNTPATAGQELVHEASSRLGETSPPAPVPDLLNPHTADVKADTPAPTGEESLRSDAAAQQATGVSSNATPPPVQPINQEKTQDQVPDASIHEPVIVKSEPIDIDFTVGTTSSNPPVLAHTGAEATVETHKDDQPAVGVSTYGEEESHAMQPVDTSMEEDPLLAELFPTFPMGGSPAHASHPQAEEESDPLLAGMLQELDATNGHDHMGYDNPHGNDFTGSWNPWAEVPHVIPETLVIAAIQAVSVTGALRLGGTFLARFPLHLGMKSVFVPNPTTGEDARALHEAGLDVKLYRFFDRANGGVDFAGMCEDLARAPEQSIVLLHVSGSSPTGASLITSQWRTLIDILKVRFSSAQKNSDPQKLIHYRSPLA
ncbi:hypothetical protein QFC19_001716 [Naganishia cerealis]|uniref:Uncharacterized protein n=1 Tax=Naganishia cerealis TaxID=610337 RepID=A0ACC2WFY5_9TREE|nr:hypothetical protein QFC19_001716 [Naganishia cerealis]